MKTLPETLSNYPEIEREFKEWYATENLNVEIVSDFSVEQNAMDFKKMDFRDQVGWIEAYLDRDYNRVEIERYYRTGDYTPHIYIDSELQEDNLSKEAEDVLNCYYKTRQEAFITGFEELLKLMSNEQV